MTRTPHSPRRRRATRAAATLAGTSALALALPGTLPTASAAPAALPSTLTVVCPDIGQVTVHLKGNLATATTDAGPVSLTGRRVTATGSGGTVTEGTVPTSAVACEAATLRGVAATSVLGTDAARRVGGGNVTAQVQFGVTADTAAVIAAAANAPRTSSVMASVANDPAGYGAVRAFPSNWGVASYVAGSGSLAVAYRGQGDSVIYYAGHGTTLNVTASIVKVQIMATVMYQAQQQGRGLTAWEKSELIPMIHQSSNDAATALWNHVGKGPAVARVLARMGLRNTVPGSGSYWGLTVTSATDQVVLVDHFARANPVLNSSMRAYGLTLMRGVSSAQNWGVTAGPGTDNAVKNGWLPRSDGWHVNSVGYLDDAPRHYTMAALSQSPTAGMSTLIGRIQGASRRVWAHQHGARGDWNGDGRADVAGVHNGYLSVALSTGSSLAAPRTVGHGWGTMRWVGSPGDVTGDGITDVLAVNRSGHLLLYPGTGRPGLSSARDLGSGWAGYTQIATPGDFTGDGVPDLVARASNGAIRLFTTHGSHAPTLVRTLAAHWTLTNFYGAGDFDNDGRGDLVGRTATGRLVSFRSTGSAVATLRTSGPGWPSAGLAVPGDLNGDVVSDIVGTFGSSRVRIWRMGLGGTFGSPVTTGVSMAGWTHLF